jgi:hypothetical protein
VDGAAAAVGTAVTDRVRALEHWSSEANPYEYGPGDVEPNSYDSGALRPMSSGQALARDNDDYLLPVRGMGDLKQNSDDSGALGRSRVSGQTLAQDNADYLLPVSTQLKPDGKAPPIGAVPGARNSYAGMDDYDTVMAEKRLSLSATVVVNNLGNGPPARTASAAEPSTYNGIVDLGVGPGAVSAIGAYDLASPNDPYATHTYGAQISSGQAQHAQAADSAHSGPKSSRRGRGVSNPHYRPNQHHP